jgi:hypothetical protein
LNLLDTQQNIKGGYMRKRSFVFAATLLFFARLFGQGIQVKTIPLLSTDQFAMTPSFRDDMGGVTLALRDPCQDLWENPARFSGSKSHLFLAPRLNHWSYGQETAYHYRSGSPLATTSEMLSSSRLFALPAAFVYRNGNSYGSGLLAAQTVSAQNSNQENFNAGNFPFAAAAGHYFPALRTAIGLGASYIHLEGMDGVYLLYPNASRLSQRGRARQLRIGLAGDLKSGDGWSLAASRYDYRMRQSALGVENMDENEGWSVHADYTKRLSPVLDAALSLAWDQKHHPKIPEYPLASIPRDPGNTRGLSIGAGLKWQQNQTLAAIDLVYEPIDVKTWADAAGDVTAWDGRIFHKGDITMRNDYQFHNLIVRSGGQISPLSWLDLRSGLQVRFYSYDYYQNDFINRIEHRTKPQREWTEFEYTSGATVKLKNLDLTYSLRIQMGTGLLERQWFWFWNAMEKSFAQADFIVPPTATLNVTPVTYYTQRITLRYYF